VRLSTSEGAGGRGRDGQARLGAVTEGKGRLFAVAYKARSTLLVTALRSHGYERLQICNCPHTVSRWMLLSDKQVQGLNETSSPTLAVRSVLDGRGSQRAEALEDTLFPIMSFLIVHEELVASSSSSICRRQ
jgi:hypothetical protein